MRAALTITIGFGLAACTPSGGTTAPEPEPAVETEPEAEPEAEPEPEPAPEPDFEALPAGADAALPALHQTDIDRIATLSAGEDTLVVYSYNQLDEHVARRTPELRAEMEAARVELQREWRRDRLQLPRDEFEETERNEPSCEVLARTGAAGLSDQAARCEVLALAQFDSAGAMVAQSILSDQPCRTGAAGAELRDFSGHGDDELVLVASVGTYGTTDKGYGLAESRERFFVFHLKFRREALVPLFEVDLSERDLRTANPSVTERRLRVDARGLEMFSAVTEGNCGPNAAPSGDDGDDEDDEGDDDDAADTDAESCTTYSADRYRWDRFEGRYQAEKPMKLEAAEIEQVMATLPRVP